MYSNCYLPQPPRAWSRVQNSCSLITDNNPGFNLVRDPYTNEFIAPSVLAERIAMLNKGNVLQYKANSSNLTKSQRYSKIAKGQWINRNTTWATQSTRGYTNPNTTKLKRTGDVINIAINPVTGEIIGPTINPPTCPNPIIQINEDLPANEGTSGTGEEPEIPPPVEPSEGSDVFPPIIAEEPVEPIIIQDGGSLICSIQEDNCTGEVKRHVSQQLCNPTSDSDVPGPIQLLCWNDGTQTWYPRQRYTMSNSTDKWPINYKLLVSAVKPPAPLLTATTENCFITLNWYSNNPINNCNCLQITGYNIYLDDKLYQKVPSSVNSITFFGPLKQYTIYVKSTSNDIESVSSNVINVFQSKNIVILEKSNIKYTLFTGGVIIETTFLPVYNGGGQGIAELSSCINHPINMLLIAGGGGGGCGNNSDTTGPGGGAGGGSIININGFIPPLNEKISLFVGSGGGGKTPGNAGNGNSSGQLGYQTQIITSSGNVLCNPGTPGLGAGATSKGGGDGGTSTGTIGLGYGGGGGGGAENSNASSIGGVGGTGYNGGQIGDNGGMGSTNNPGLGGNSGLPSYNVPMLGLISPGGGGSGGSSTTSIPGGQNATNYGGGGGGGAKNSNSGNNNIGGNGANGVIIIWGLL